MIRRLLRRFLRARHAEGGALPPHTPCEDSQPAILSPGWVELPPGADERYAEEFLRAMNQPRRRS